MARTSSRLEWYKSESFRIPAKRGARGLAIVGRGPAALFFLVFRFNCFGKELVIYLYVTIVSLVFRAYTPNTCPLNKFILLEKITF